MNIEIYYLFICLFLIRAIFQWKETNLTIKNNLIMLVLEIIIICPSFPKDAIILALFLMNYHLLIFISEDLAKENKVALARAIQFIFILLASGFIVKIFNIQFSPYCLKYLNKIKINNSFFSLLNNNHIKIIIISFCGLLIILKELNNIIVFILESIKFKTQIFNTDKAIGIIERILFYFLTLSGHYYTIGFILAGKAFLLSKKLDNKDFAECVLVGTLLSSSLSVLTGSFFAFLIKLG